uniref:Uncharacterized protein n=1 Tax=Moniliophthora roreri TaxID=221103 RepID=A0A0W0FXB9_MONRR
MEKASGMMFSNVTDFICPLSDNGDKCIYLHGPDLYAVYPEKEDEGISSSTFKKYSINSANSSYPNGFNANSTTQTQKNKAPEVKPSNLYEPTVFSDYRGLIL